MATVIIHTKDELSETNWLADTREFTRVPVIGEYVSLSFSGEWYKVILVAHAPFKGDYDAEIYAAKGLGHAQAIKAAGGGGPTEPTTMTKEAADVLLGEEG